MCICSPIISLTTHTNHIAMSQNDFVTIFVERGTGDDFPTGIVERERLKRTITSYTKEAADNQKSEYVQIKICV